jgi:hypothetical protein
MLSQGPIPRLVHGLVEYVAALAFIAAPFVLGFSDLGPPTAASIAVGVLLLFVAATSDGPISLVDQIPVGAHVVLDYLLAGFLIASPFIFGFSDDDAPRNFFIAVGVVHLLLTIGTRFVPPPDRASREARGRRRGLRRGRREEPAEPARASPPAGEEPSR